MRPVTKSVRYNEDGSPLTFHHWDEAKTDMLNELGKYCSFCEREGYRSSLAIEHIFPKDLDKYEHLKFRWDNFLLGCINCNSTKGTKDIDPSHIYLPNLDNLLTTVEILEGGAIQVKGDLPEDVRNKTIAFIELVGIDRDPSHPRYSEKDDRWESRLKVWEIATDFCRDYQDQQIRLERIVQMAQWSGYFSVWLKVFRAHPEVKELLIRSFSGTDTGCFDENFEPVVRIRQ